MFQVGDTVTLNSSYKGWRQHQIGMKAWVRGTGGLDLKVELENREWVVLNREYFSPFVAKKKYHPLTEIFK